MIPQGLLKQPKFNTCANALRLAFIDGRGRVTRQTFGRICNEHGIGTPAMQAYFEGAGLVVEPTFYDRTRCRDRDWFVWPLMSHDEVKG